MSKEKNPAQILRKDGKNCFVESLCDSFEIDKMHLCFVNYDTGAEKGSRQTAKIDIYVDAPEWIAWTADIALHYTEKQLAKAKAETSYEPVLQTMGGVSADLLKKRGQERSDGKSLSRIMTVGWGQKVPVLMMAKSGPGEQDAKGLIVPKFGKNPEHQVMIPLSYKDFAELFLMTKAHYEAYLVYRYAKEKPFQRKDKDDQGNKEPQTKKSAATYY